MDILTPIKMLAALASAVTYLLSGITFGCLDCKGVYKLIEDDFGQFCFLYARGYCLYGFIYCLCAMCVSGINVYYDGFIIPVCLIWLCFMAALLASCIVTSSQTKLDPPELIYVGSGIPLLVKLPHTLYYTVDLLVNDQDDTGKFVFMSQCLVAEMIWILIWSLIPVLASMEDINRSPKDWFGKDPIRFLKNMPLTVWALEVADIASHIVVCCVYAHSVSHWDSVLKAYVAFFIINVYVFLVPFVPCFLIDKNAMGIHILVVDVLTDLPVFIISIARQTYHHHTWIMIDLFIKWIIFIRGAVFVQFFTTCAKPAKDEKERVQDDERDDFD